MKLFALLLSLLAGIALSIPTSEQTVDPAPNTTTTEPKEHFGVELRGYKGLWCEGDLVTSGFVRQDECKTFRGQPGFESYMFAPAIPLDAKWTAGEYGSCQMLFWTVPDCQGKPSSQNPEVNLDSSRHFLCNLSTRGPPLKSALIKCAKDPANPEGKEAGKKSPGMQAEGFVA